MSFQVKGMAAPLLGRLLVTSAVGRPTKGDAGSKPNPLIAIIIILIVLIIASAVGFFLIKRHFQKKRRPAEPIRTVTSDKTESKAEEGLQKHYTAQEVWSCWFDPMLQNIRKILGYEDVKKMDQEGVDVDIQKILGYGDVKNMYQKGLEYSAKGQGKPSVIVILNENSKLGKNSEDVEKYKTLLKDVSLRNGQTASDFFGITVKKNNETLYKSR
ncbi:hypothetical protein F4778DRAFT_776370 [Xylariomycetidae sp. FL2044]|nr:hypothetical protein F4778DRAFT_776370 [Xylariomycetidae sp. FL2044]